MTETAMKKAGVGRRKIPIQMIENKTKRNVTFSKRKAGLFKKAGELSTLCGSEIAVLVFSESGKAFTFGNPSADSLVQRYIHGSTKISTTQSGISTQFGCGAFGWDNPIDTMGLDQLKQYSNYLQNIRDTVAAKVAKSMDCSSPPPFNMSDMGHMATITTHVSSNHGSSNDLSVQENSFGGLEMHSNNLEELNNTLDVERAMIDSPTSVVGDNQLTDYFNWMEAESSEYMLYGEGMLDYGYKQQIADVLISPTTSSNDFYVQEESVDDVQLGDLDPSKCLEELIDFYDVKSPIFDSPTDVNGDTQLSTDCFKWKEANSSDVNGDLVSSGRKLTSSNDSDVPVDDEIDFSKYLEELIDFYDVKSPMVDSPTDVNGDNKLSDCFKWKVADSSDYMFVGEGAMIDGYEQSDVLPSSFVYVDVDADLGNSLCDVQWEDDQIKSVVVD